MKKVFLMAYARMNLGDDIFIKMLLDKYPYLDFYMKIKDHNFLKGLEQYNNLHIIIADDTDEELYKGEVEEYDAYVYIGGSIFIEGGKVYNLSPKFYDFVKRCKEKNILFCYMSSNYGPYQTQEYFELSKANFEVCTDICFRDKYSYNLFKEIENVRYAPDFGFGYDMEADEKIPNSIGISVINLEDRPELKEVSNHYEKFLIKNVEKYLNEGNKVYLYSFCKDEGDEILLDKIVAEFPGNPNLIEIKYDGDVDKFLNIYSKMEYMICARFHAMILSAIFRQNLLVMTYSQKTTNVIEDLELDVPIIDLKEVDENMILEKYDFKNVEEDKLQKIIEESKEQDRVFREKIL